MEEKTVILKRKTDKMVYRSAGPHLRKVKSETKPP